MITPPESSNAAFTNLNGIFKSSFLGTCEANLNSKFLTGK